MSDVPPTKSSVRMIIGPSRASSKETSVEKVVPKDGAISEPTSTTTIIPRSASQTHLPLITEAFVAESSFERGGIKRTLSENLLSGLESGVGKQPLRFYRSRGNSEDKKKRSLDRRKSSKESGLVITEFAIAEQPNPSEGPTKLPKAVLKGDPAGKTRSVTGSLSSLARKSWLGTSRSPSPNKRSIPSTDMIESEKERNTHSSSELAKTLPQVNGDLANGFSDVVQGNDTPLPKKTRRPMSTFLGNSSPQDNSGSSSSPAIPKSVSSDRLPSFLYGPNLAEHRPPLPRSTSSDRLSSLGYDTPRKRDDLWGAFRALDGEFQKFTLKASTQKINIIRNTLLPFLRTYSNHPSNVSLRADDLDRRVHILNKWWTGLLEMLNGRNGQSISGNDRPAVLEAVTDIMIRPEWRLPSSAISTRVEKLRSSLRSKSTTSLELTSISSEFLAESVLLNTRNTFVQNLLSQMAFVVDKMSMRTVPASVVTFCGKAAAYAFFFCPGVADILVRLWSLQSEPMRRVLNELNISRNSNLTEIAAQTAEYFPLHIRALSLKPLPSLMRYLRSRPHLSSSSGYIAWYGPWASRWAGRDSDLFFVFAKYFHMLTCDFLPEDTTKIERACAPCYVIVQAQMLTIIDSTIHRSFNMSHQEIIQDSLPITFDDVLGADLSVASLPLPASSMSRSMAENRSIMLLREFLSDSPLVKAIARKTFAESFGDLLRATSRQTSVFDHNACFTLCDFLEEAIGILARFHRDKDDPVSFLDWAFWLNVCKRMMESHNSMTEVRLYAFIYSLWSLATKNEMRKSDICIGWLLSEGYFQRQFNHWCPMVRAYYMRLLCWRIARFDGGTSEVDLKIFVTLSDLLNKTWRHYLHTQEHADKNGLMPPSTVACSPAPGRRLVIIRNDVHPDAGGGFLSFDSIIAASSASQPAAYERYSSLEPLKFIPLGPRGPSPSRSSSPSRKGWSLLRTINPFTNSAAEASKKNEARGESSADENPKTISRESEGLNVQPKSPHNSLSFRFALEWVDRSSNPNKHRKLFPPKLPLPAQIFVDSKRPEPPTFVALKPDQAMLGPSKYCGRALAEWAVLIVECQNFFERRKFEGVPSLKWVETPTLGVEAFRKLG